MTTETQVLETVTAYKCENGCELSEDNGGPLYECGNCGTRFNRDNSADGGSHRCPDCNKFSGKTGELSCETCGAAAVEEVEAVLCGECSELIEEDEYAAHMTEHETEKHEEETAATADDGTPQTKKQLIEAAVREWRLRFNGIHAMAFHIAENGHYVPDEDGGACCAAERRLAEAMGDHRGMVYNPPGSEWFYHGKGREHIAFLFGVTEQEMTRLHEKTPVLERRAKWDSCTVAGCLGCAAGRKMKGL